MSFSTVTTSKMELSPMRVKFKTVDLGGTLGGVTVNVEYTKAEIKADQSGDTVRDRRVSGMNISVATEIAEIKNKDEWKVVFPHARLVDDGIGHKMMYFTTNIGDSDLANAGELLLHPLSLADADLSGDYKFYKGCADAKSEIKYSPTDQATLKITWNILPDDSVQPERFFIHGDPSIGIVNASAAAAVAGGGNTGNGTVGSISVVSGVTKTETITLLCIHAAANSGIFQVSGNLSGPLGNATVAVGFSSPVIAFTIADGATDFVVGDTFTIATTAANYV